jgi:hypothetical protein
MGTVQSNVSVDLFAQFVDAFSGKCIEITGGNFEGLSELADEFGDSVLSSRLKASPVYLSRAQAKDIVDLRPEFEKLKADLSVALGHEVDRLHKSLDAAKIKSLWKKVTALQSADSQREMALARLDAEVPNLRKALDAANVDGLRQQVSVLQTSVSRAKVATQRGQLDSLIFTDAAQISRMFQGQSFKLLWRGSRDGFQVDQFHDRCDSRPYTLTLILDTDGNIFGGFTPVMWGDKDACEWTPDETKLTFIFTLKNPDDGKPRTKDDIAQRIYYATDSGPMFGDKDLCVRHSARKSTDLEVQVRPFWRQGDNELRVEVFMIKNGAYLSINELKNSLAHVAHGLWLDISIMQNRSQLVPPQMDSVIIARFPETFTEFNDYQFELLWRGSRDGFTLADFHNRCDGHAGTVTLVLDVNRLIFGVLRQLPGSLASRIHTTPHPITKRIAQDRVFFSRSKITGAFSRGSLSSPIGQRVLPFAAAQRIVRHLALIWCLRVAATPTCCSYSLRLMALTSTTHLSLHASSCKVVHNHR